MTQDLDDRLRRTLRAHASTAEPWATSGAELRGQAAARASRRHRRVLVTASALAVAAVLVAVVGVVGHGAQPSVPANPRPTPTLGDADGSPLQVDLTDEVVQDIRNQLSLGDARLAATARLPDSTETALLFTRALPAGSPGRLTAWTVTFDGVHARAGTVATIADSDPVIALPVRDLDRAVMFVLAPTFWHDGVVEVTTAEPGQEPRIRSSPLAGRVALVPVPGPDVVTGVRLLAEPDRSEVYASIPAYLLRVDVPTWLPKIAAWTGHALPQSVQVRTDGSTACRVTVGGFFPPDAFVMDWNLFDVACAPADGALHLLIAADRRYSSVAGVAPVGTTSVRLSWRDGSVTDVPVTRTGPLVAFIDASGHRPDRLVSATARNLNGDVIANEQP